MFFLSLFAFVLLEAERGAICCESVLDDLTLAALVVVAGFPVVLTGSKG